LEFALRQDEFFAFCLLPSALNPPHPPAPSPKGEGEPHAPYLTPHAVRLPPFSDYPKPCPSVVKPGFRPKPHASRRKPHAARRHPSHPSFPTLIGYLKTAPIAPHPYRSFIHFIEGKISPITNLNLYFAGTDLTADL